MNALRKKGKHLTSWEGCWDTHLEHVVSWELHWFRPCCHSEGIFSLTKWLRNGGKVKIHTGGVDSLWTVLKQGIPDSLACKMASLTQSFGHMSYPLEMGDEFGWSFGQNWQSFRPLTEPRTQKKENELACFYKTTEGLTCSVLKSSFWITQWRCDAVMILLFLWTGNRSARMYIYIYHICKYTCMCIYYI